MYEKVWSGDVDGYEISLDFIEHRGLFRYTAKKDGVLISDRLCADPVDAGLMDAPGVIWNNKTPPLPASSFISFEVRFSLFGTPEDIVGGTWLSPADWPQDRKRVAVYELAGRMNRIASRYSIDRVPDEAYLNFGLIDCSKRLNAMFGGPEKWPRAAFELLLTATGYKELALGKASPTATRTCSPTRARCLGRSSNRFARRQHLVCGMSCSLIETPLSAFARSPA